MQKFLIIQTAFIGDVVLATAIPEKLHRYFPDAQIDFLVRKGNEGLLLNNPCISNVLIWDKKNNKNKNLFTLLKHTRRARYDKVINLQRYFATGMLTAFSRARETRGFDKNPLSWLFDKKVKHVVDVRHPRHEVEKNNDLIKDFTDDTFTKPVLYPSAADVNAVTQYMREPYVTMTPSSVWFTKKFPVEKWIDVINNFNPSYSIYLLGGKENTDENAFLQNQVNHQRVISLAGTLTFLQSAALMRSAAMNYVNDSAPLHFASGVNAPVTAVYCSTVPAFGFTPLSDKSFIVQRKEPLACRPCGIHGYKACPLKHFACAHSIDTRQVLETIYV